MCACRQATSARCGARQKHTRQVGGAGLARAPNMRRWAAPTHLQERREQQPMTGPYPERGGASVAAKNAPSPYMHSVGAGLPPAAAVLEGRPAHPLAAATPLATPGLVHHGNGVRPSLWGETPSPRPTKPGPPPSSLAQVPPAPTLNTQRSLIVPRTARRQRPCPMHGVQCSPAARPIHACKIYVQLHSLRTPADPATAVLKSSCGTLRKLQRQQWKGIRSQILSTSPLGQTYARGVRRQWPSQGLRGMREGRAWAVEGGKQQAGTASPHA